VLVAAAVALAHPVAAKEASHKKHHVSRAKKPVAPKIAFTSSSYKVEQIVPPSTFHGVQGLAFGLDGALYAGSVLGRTISKVDVATGKTMTFLGSPRGSAGDVAFGPDGTIAWVAVRDGAILTRTPDGAIRTVARDVPGVHGVGFAKNGRLYFSRTGEEDGLYEVNPDDPDAPRMVTPNVAGLGPFQIDSKGKLYGSALFRRELVKIDLATGEMSRVADGFTSPSTVRLGLDGAPIVLERRSGEFVRVNVETGDKEVVAKLDPPVDTFAIAKDGTIFAATAAFNGITAIDPKTHVARRVTWSALSAPGMITIIPKDDGEDIIAADALGIRRIDAKSGATALVGNIGDVTIGTSVAIDGDLLAIGNTWPTGSLQFISRESGELRAHLTNFGAPYGIVPVSDGVVVADYTVGRLTKVANDAANTRTTIAWGFDGPVGLADAGKGEFYVSEYDAGRITRVDTKNNERTTVLAGLSRPEGIAMAPDGRLIVAEVGARRVLAVNLSKSDTVEILAEQLAIGLDGAGSGPNLPTGVAVGKDGAIYVSGDIDNVVYRLTRPEAPPTPPKDAPTK
jgi:sugar lactone lactonase YvrE